MGWITAAIPSTYDDSSQYAADRALQMWKESHQFTLILKGIRVAWTPFQRPIKGAYNLEGITPEMLPNAPEDASDVSLEQMMEAWKVSFRPSHIFWFNPVAGESQTWASQTWDAAFDKCVADIRRNAK